MLDLGIAVRRHSQALHFSPPHKEDIKFLVMTCVAVGVGSRIGPQIRSQVFLKTVAHTIRLADGFMKGATTIHRLRCPTPANLLLLALDAAKALVKGASKGVIVKDNTARFRKIFKALKASEGAFNLVKYSNVVNYGVGDPLEAVIKGYKLTKSAFNVLDGVNGVRLEGYGGIKEAMEGVGVVVKAMVLYKQTHGFLIQGLRVSHQIWEAVRNIKNEEERSKEKMQKIGLHSGNPCELGCLGLRYLSRDYLEHGLFLSLPCQAVHLAR